MISEQLIIPAKIDAAYILHMDRSTQRAPQVEKLKAMLGEKAHVFRAIDSREMSAQDRDRVYKQRLQKPYYPFKLSDNEIACFLSYRAIWAKIVNDNHEYALVLEDDVDLNPKSFQGSLNLFKGTPEQNGLYRLPEEKRHPSQRQKQRCIRPLKIGLGMQAQIISKEAAKKLLNTTDVFDRPVDTTLQMYWLHGVPFFEIYPSGVTEIDQNLGGTTIQRRKKPLTENAIRTVLRVKYRFHINLKSKISYFRKPTD